MAVSIDQLFDTKFRSQVKVQYQRKGPKLRSSCTVDTSVMAETVVFKKLGAGVATTKGRHGVIPIMNLDHSTVQANMQDYYAAEYEDDLDRLKNNAMMQSRYADSIAMALGRQWDQVAITAAAATPNLIDDGGVGMTLAKILETEEQFNENDIPPEDRFYWIGPAQFRNMKENIDQFVNIDYSAEKRLQTGGAMMFSYNTFNFIVHSGLPLNIEGPNNVRSCYAVHRDALGIGVNKEITTKVSFLDDRDTHQVMGKMSLGGVIIEDTGVIEVQCVEA